MCLYQLLLLIDRSGGVRAEAARRILCYVAPMLGPSCSLDVLPLLVQALYKKWRNASMSSFDRGAPLYYSQLIDIHSRVDSAALPP